jgi:hypothetical protein
LRPAGIGAEGRQDHPLAVGQEAAAADAATLHGERRHRMVVTGDFAVAEPEHRLVAENQRAVGDLDRDMAHSPGGGAGSWLPAIQTKRVRRVSRSISARSALGRRSMALRVVEGIAQAHHGLGLQPVDPAPTASRASGACRGAAAASAH